jgi:hypothetical protein
LVLDVLQKGKRIENEGVAAPQNTHHPACLAEQGKKMHYENNIERILQVNKYSLCPRSRNHFFR